MIRRVCYSALRVSRIFNVFFCSVKYLRINSTALCFLLMKYQLKIQHRMIFLRYEKVFRFETAGSIN